MSTPPDPDQTPAPSRSGGWVPETELLSLSLRNSVNVATPPPLAAAAGSKKKSFCICRCERRLEPRRCLTHGALRASIRGAGERGHFLDPPRGGGVQEMLSWAMWEYLRNVPPRARGGRGSRGGGAPRRCGPGSGGRPRGDSSWRQRARERATACQPALFPGPGARALPGPDGRQRTPPGRGRRREPPGLSRRPARCFFLRECPDQRLRALREERARWAAPSLAEGCAAADEELVPIHVVQA